MMIIGGDLFKNNKIPITQKNICNLFLNLGVFISSMMFLSDIMNQMNKIIVKNFYNEVNSLSEITSLISKIVYSGKQKILEISLEW